MEEVSLHPLSYLPDQHQTAMIMIMSSKDGQLNQSEKPFDFYDDVSVLYMFSL